MVQPGSKASLAQLESKAQSERLVHKVLLENKDYRVPLVILVRLGHKA